MLIKCLLCSVRKRVRISLCSEHGTIEGQGLNVRDGREGRDREGQWVRREGERVEKRRVR